MTQSPREDDSSIDRKTGSREEPERERVSAGHEEQPQHEEQTPPTRRCDSAHREILRQPFSIPR